MRSLGVLVVLASCVAPVLADGPIQPQEVRDQNERFEQLWQDKLEWRFSELPTKGNVPKFRMPYSGAIYPDRAGGTLHVMEKYDRAFHRGQPLAVRYERDDIARQTSYRQHRGGLFGLRTTSVSYMPSWSGHCNGWTAAAIRHAEPQKSVTRNGVTFTPSDVKALLAELYTYSDTAFLGGLDRIINPGMFHVTLTNWLGRKSYPIGMEAAPDREVWNYPIYSYAYSSAPRAGGRQVEVRLNVAHTMLLDREYDKAPSRYRIAFFHYLLDLDSEGRITGGRYYPDSTRIDMLWVPLPPAQGGRAGNERGNPHLDVNEVLALWRESVPEEVHAEWANAELPAYAPQVADEPPAAKPDEAPAEPEMTDPALNESAEDEGVAPEEAPMEEAAVPAEDEAPAEEDAPADNEAPAEEAEQEESETPEEEAAPADDDAPTNEPAEEQVQEEAES